MTAHRYTHVEVVPGCLSGTVAAPPSKSMCHRALIGAALSERPSTLENVLLSDDVMATLEGVRQMGAQVLIDGQGPTVPARVANPGMATFYRGRAPKALELPPDRVISCRSSGTTARLLIPLFHLYAGATEYRGTPQLSRRPMGPYVHALGTHGAEITFPGRQGKTPSADATDGLPLHIRGTLHPGAFELPGDVSSQFVSGLLMSVCLLDGDSTVRVNAPFESRGYVDMTRQCMERFGVSVKVRDAAEYGGTLYTIRGHQYYRGQDVVIEGDYSQAAFWLVAAKLGKPICVTGLDEWSVQPDRCILDYLSSGVRRCRSVISVDNTLKLPQRVDASQCPDLVPILAVLCALTPGYSEIRGAGRVRIKESDRLSAITQALNAVGGRVVERPDGLDIDGVLQLTGGTVDACEDHRIAMAMAVAATVASAPITILGASCVEKSYPHFWTDFRRLGGRCHEL